MDSNKQNTLQSIRQHGFSNKEVQAQVFATSLFFINRVVAFLNTITLCILILTVFEISSVIEHYTNKEIGAAFCFILIWFMIYRALPKKKKGK
jgi:hypothetical protein